MAKVSMEATIAAKRFGPKATNFGYLAVGDLFAHTNDPHPANPTVLRKTSELGWYVEVANPRRKWRTTAGCSVIKIEKELS